MRRASILSAIAVFLLAICAPATASAQEKPLDNAEIVKLYKLDMGDDVIVAKIKAARQVNFNVGTDELVRLRQAGVSKAIIAAMIEKSAEPASPKAGAAGSDPSVSLVTSDGTHKLGALYGEMKTQNAVFSVQSWLQFPDLAAKLRIRDRQPSLLLSSARDPRGAWWVVHLSQYNKRDEIYRYFDLEGGGGFAATFSGSPEKGSVVKYDAVETEPGVWKLTLQKELKPGEYGLFFGGGKQGGAGGMLGTSGETLLFDFGVDR